MHFIELDLQTNKNRGILKDIELEKERKRRSLDWTRTFVSLKKKHGNVMNNLNDI